MVKIAGSIVLAFPFIEREAEALLALLGISNGLLAVAIAMWIATGAFTDLRRAYVTTHRRRRGS